MAGSVGERSRELASGVRTVFMRQAEEPPGGSQRARSSEEAGYDRGAKGPREVENEMAQNSENKPAAVGGDSPVTASRFPKQVGEAQSPWAWVEQSVWTTRMLDRLAKSEEQTVWFSLWDKIWSEKNLDQAALEVILNRGSAGVDGQTTRQFSQEWSEEIARLQAELRQGRYRPRPAKRVWIDKLGSREKRPLGIPAVRDRVVQAALRHVLEPIFERDFAEQSYGFRPGRGCLGALQRVEELLESGYTFVVDADLKSYFDTIPQERLLGLMKARVADGRVLQLVEAFLQAGVMEQGKDWQASECGTPQGGVISPLLANIYLNPLDHLMAKAGVEMVRYADDLVLLCRSEAEAQAALAMLSAWVTEAGLTLHPSKTRIVDASAPGGFDFLGYHFERYAEGGGKKWFRKKSEAKLRASVRAKTSRLRSGSMSEMIAELNPTLRGWFAYYRYSAPGALAGVDGWVRRRLRSIQRWRWGRKGSSRGRENVEMPNAWFAAHGLFSLLNAQRSRSPIP